MHAADGVSGAIFRFGANSDAFPFGNLALAPAADAGRSAAKARIAIYTVLQ
jgi:hypothetical protein